MPRLTWRIDRESRSYLPGAAARGARTGQNDVASTFFPHEPDHIIANRHGGQSIAENLALTCFDCNRFKGSDIASLDPASGNLTPLFDPRSQKWSEHFSLIGGVISPLTATGRMTELVMKLNLASRVEVREILAGLGRYPGNSK